MKKGTIVAIAVAAVLLLIVILGISSYNGLVNAEVKADEKSSTVGVMLTRRADLIPI